MFKRVSIAAAVMLAAPLLVLNAGPSAALTSAPTVMMPPKATDTWLPTQGITLNNPLGRSVPRNVILLKIRNAIRHSPNGSNIDFGVWNVRSLSAVNDLLAAQKRGVRVRVVIDSHNASRDAQNNLWKKLVTGLSRGNANRPYARKSRAMKCYFSCRGTAGQAHNKFYLFSKTGAATDVMMIGSANLTTAAVTGQWNDLYTTRTNKPLYDYTLAYFNQLLQDKPVNPAYTTFTSPAINVSFFPFTGATATVDPVLAVLNTVKCTGVTAGHGSNGRTLIRVAQNTFGDGRGLRIADKLRTLWKQGCDVKIIYAIMGPRIRKLLLNGGARGSVPFRPIVQDFNGDFVLDRYLHSKAMAISGNVDGNPAGEVALSGSANWSGLALYSDDSTVVLPGRSNTLPYLKYVDYWFKHPPTIYTHANGSGYYKARVGKMTYWPDLGYVPSNINPYRLIEQEG